jgi:hypothetical protein
MDLQTPLTTWQRLIVQNALMPGRKLESLPQGLPELICDTVESTPTTKTIFVFQDDLPEYQRYWPLYVYATQTGASMQRFDLTEFFSLQARREAALGEALMAPINEFRDTLSDCGVVISEDTLLTATKGAAKRIFESTHGLASKLNTSFFEKPDAQTLANIKAQEQYIGSYASILMGQRPFLAVVVLPAVAGTINEQHMLHISRFREAISLDETHPALLAVAGHEAGHAKLHYTQHGVIGWIHEKSADTNRIHALNSLGLCVEAKTEMSLRLVDGVIGAMNKAAAIYWNNLAQVDGSEFSSQVWHRDVAAQLEIKQRAMAYLIGSEAVPAISRYANRFADASLNARSYAKLRKAFDVNNITSGRQEALLFALERVVADGQFTHTGSRELAEMTLVGARNVAPKTFSSNVWSRYLRDKPNYLAP